MDWYQISARCARVDAPSVAERMERHGAVAVSFLDAADDPVLEPSPGEAILWRHTRVQGLFRDPGDGLGALSDDLTRVTGERPRVQPVSDRDWLRQSQADLAPAQFGDDLWVVPHGHAAPVGARATVALEPGIAFGTGAHPTTRLCLEWLSRQRDLGELLIDFGCGSGILAIAGLKLGAVRAVLVDIDPQALEAAGTNAARNRVETRVERMDPDSFARCVRGSATTLVANILLAPLVELAPVLLGALAPGGRLCLAGILSHQVDALVGAYESAMQRIEVRSLDGWARVSGVRRSGVGGRAGPPEQAGRCLAIAADSDPRTGE